MTTRRRHRRSKGQTLLLFALLAVIIVGFTGLSLDFGHAYLVRRDSQTASDSAALAAGKQWNTGGDHSGPPASGDAVFTAAHDYALQNGFSTTSTACYSSTSNVAFDPSNTSNKVTQATTTFVDTGSCSASTGWTTQLKVSIPPTLPSYYIGVCESAPYDCVQVSITYQIANYFSAVIGFPNELTTTVATAYAKPASGGAGSPPANAVVLYEPRNNCTGQCFTEGTAPSRSQFDCSTADTYNCPTLWATSTTASMITGYDGSQATSPAHFTALESNGDIYLQGQTTFCDPYGSPAGGTNCKANKVVGTNGFSVEPPSMSGGVAIPKDYCKTWNGGVAAPATQYPQGCVTPAAAGTDQSWGNEVPYSQQFNWKPTVWAENSSQWSSVYSAGAPPSCGGLVLNGDSVANSFSANTGGVYGTHAALCTPQSGDDYTIQPGIYSFIVINHGQYEFGPGVYYIDGKAPVDTLAATSSGYKNGPGANGIDHSREDSTNVNNDLDLCPHLNDPTKCASLTAGVWIGHGQGWFGDFEQTTGTCSTGGGSQGGGDQTSVFGNGVTFVLGASAGGFASTGEVQQINLSAPAPNESQPVGDVPLLFDEQPGNNSFMHLDGGAGGTGSRFSGIVYQDTGATGGGVELDNNINPNGASVYGQVFAYSLALFGGGNAGGINFQNGWGASASSQPSSGHSENVSDKNYTSPTVSHANGYTTWTFYYNDEWALDAYNLNAAVNGAPAVYFSEGTWQGTPTSFPPENQIPSDTTISNTQTDAVNPRSPAKTPSSWSSSYGSYATGTLYQSYPSTAHPGNSSWDWIETVKDPTYTNLNDTFEVTGDWIWGHEKDWDQANNQKSMDNPDTAAMAFTFPTPPGASFTITVFMEDGDHCGDYWTSTATYATAGGPNGGILEAGGVDLEQ